MSLAIVYVICIQLRLLALQVWVHMYVPLISRAYQTIISWWEGMQLLIINVEGKFLNVKMNSKDEFKPRNRIFCVVVSTKIPTSQKIGVGQCTKPSKVVKNYLVFASNCLDGARALQIVHFHQPRPLTTLTNAMYCFHCAFTISK